MWGREWIGARLRTAGVGLLGLGLASAATAAPDATVPEGYMKLTIAGGAVTSRISTVLSVPLLRHSTASGQLAGTITSVNSTGFSNSSAGWTPGELSSPTSPHIVRITSGTAAGRTFLISTSVANTSTGLTLDAADLAGSTPASASIAVGDRYSIHRCETLLSLLGTPQTTGVQGGGSLASADQVQLLFDGAWQTYFYSSTKNHWVQNTFGFPDRNHLPLRPDTGLVYGRMAASPIQLEVHGTVPATNRQASVRNSGSMLLANGWPVKMTLAKTRLHLMQGWVSAPTFAQADKVQAYLSGTWRSYWHDGTNWRENTFGFPIRNDTEIFGESSCALILRKNANPGASLTSQTLPYSIQP